MNQKTAGCLIPCEGCGGKVRTQLVPGPNDVVAICDQCGNKLHIVVDYDETQGLASILAGKIEKMA